MKFYNREEEFETLNKLKKDFRVVILGNRRVGKTRLVEEFYKKHCITFFVAGEKAEKEVINGWAMEYETLHLPKVDNFKEFFEFVFLHLKRASTNYWLQRKLSCRLNILCLAHNGVNLLEKKEKILMRLI